jgi:hypothetical protein
LLSLQAIAVPTWQVPPPQVSPAVQAFPSSQELVLFVKTQPVAGSHVSVVQGLLSSQATGAPGRQAPPLHVSPVVHTLPSSHGFVLSMWTHPVAELQESSVHGLSSLQAIAAPGWQVPPPHVSPVVQALPSSHGLELFV